MQNYLFTTELQPLWLWTGQAVLGYEIDSRSYQASYPVATGSFFLGVEVNCIMKLTTQIQQTMNVRMLWKLYLHAPLYPLMTRYLGEI
jgi:hypothetical protein